MTDLENVPTAKLREELEERERVENAKHANALRDWLESTYGRCRYPAAVGPNSITFDDPCLAPLVGYRLEDRERIRLSGILGHDPGEYGFEADVIATCEHGHESLVGNRVVLYEHPIR